MNNELNYSTLTTKTKEEILSLYKTNEDGLNHNEVEERIEEYGEWL